MSGDGHGGSATLASGSAYVLPGGAAGLGTMPIATLAGDAIAMNFGRSVACADRRCPRRVNAL
ncbi:MAG: hypothetical protein WCJ30_20605 [Deltaproteobacteria bacterium]